MKKLIISLFLLSAIVYVNAQNDKAMVLQNLEKAQPASQDVKLTATLKSATRLFGEKDDLTTVIMILPSGTVVSVIGSDSTYLHVIYEEDEGYIFRRHAVMNKATVETPVVKKQVPVQVEQPEPQPQQVSRFTYLENKYGTNMAAKLIAGKIWKGMSSEMVRDSWGKPQKINRVIGSDVIREEWIYKNSWLYIENDFLVEWGPIRN